MKMLNFLVTSIIQIVILDWIAVTSMALTTPTTTVLPTTSANYDNNVGKVGSDIESSNRGEELKQKIDRLSSYFKLLEYLPISKENYTVNFEKNNLAKLVVPGFDVFVDLNTGDQDYNRRYRTYRYRNILVYGLDDFEAANVMIDTSRSSIDKNNKVTATLDMRFSQLFINGTFSDDYLESLPIDFEIKLYGFVKYHETADYELRGGMTIRSNEVSDIKYDQLRTANLSHETTYYNEHVIPKIASAIKIAVTNTVDDKVKSIIKKNELSHSKLESIIQKELEQIRDHLVSGEDLINKIVK